MEFRYERLTMRMRRRSKAKWLGICPFLFARQLEAATPATDVRQVTSLLDRLGIKYNVFNVSQ